MLTALHHPSAPLPIFEGKMNNLKTRIPKIFSPIKYTISLYIDILSLNYTIEEEIKIISELDNSPYLILNAHLSYFKIISLSLQKFDIFSDDFVIGIRFN